MPCKFQILMGVWELKSESSHKGVDLYVVFEDIYLNMGGVKKSVMVN